MTRRLLLAAAALSTALAVQAAPPAVAPAVEPRAVVGRIADRIEAVYFDPRAAARIAEGLRADAASGRFDALSDPRELSAVLSDRLKKDDAHFVVVWTPPEGAPSAAPANPPHGPPAAAPDDGAVERENDGFRRIEVLPGNVGLIELTLFGDFQPESSAGDARAVADAALALVARAQALVIDLRDCRGGSPAMVGYLVGHFVGADADVYNTFKSRGPDRSERPTVPIPEPRRLDLPLYVVVNGRTGSAAESFAYTLQSAHRATIVGERTAGGANPGGLHDVGDGLAVFVSSGSPVNPITHRNWEGDGVVPDRAAASADAQDAAYELALDALAARPGSGPAANEARWALDALRSARAGAAVAPEERARYAGRYGTREVRDQNGALIYLQDRRPPKRLLPLGGDVFALEGAPFYHVEFERDASGAVTGMLVRLVGGAVARVARTG